ncbi:polyprenol monophosphomannose synthase [Nanoarchaeota archaeon]
MNHLKMISIIIPTYNEAENIKKIVPLIYKHMKKDYEIVIVDDNSPDKTWQIAQKMPKKYKIRVIRRTKERGLATAVIRGFKEAKGNIIGVIDADLSHPPKMIPKLVAAIKDGNCVAVGSRHVKGGGCENWPVHRKMISKGATLMARPLTRVKDPMSGFFFFKKDILKGVTLKPKGYKILLEILVKGRYSKNKVKEIPFIFKDRELGKSKLGFNVYIDYLKHLGSLFKYKTMGK